MAFGFASLLAPSVAHRIALITVGSLVGEVALTVWLLAVGIDPLRFQKENAEGGAA